MTELDEKVYALYRVYKKTYKNTYMNKAYRRRVRSMNRCSYDPPISYRPMPSYSLECWTLATATAIAETVVLAAATTS